MKLKWYLFENTARSTYAAATKTRTDDSAETSSAEISNEAANAGDLLCPFAAKGECRFGEQCAYTHGDLCELCGMAILHPTDQEQRENHMKVKQFIRLGGFMLLGYQTCTCTECHELEQKADSVNRFRVQIFSSSAKLCAGHLLSAGQELGKFHTRAKVDSENNE